MLSNPIAHNFDWFFSVEFDEGLKLRQNSHRKDDAEQDAEHF